MVSETKFLRDWNEKSQIDVKTERTKSTSNRIPLVAANVSNQYISAENVSRQNDNTLRQRLVLYCSSRLTIDHYLEIAHLSTPEVQSSCR